MHSIYLYMEVHYTLHITVMFSTDSILCNYTLIDFMHVCTHTSLNKTLTSVPILCNFITKTYSPSFHNPVLLVLYCIIINNILK